MDFNFVKDFAIFDSFLEKRPEISTESLKHELLRYYLPYVHKLIDLKQKKSPDDGMIVGVSAIQGTGKTTQGEILEILLKHLGHSSDSRSIDDHYITHKELCELRTQDPRYIRRGVTHDIGLAIQDLENLQSMTNAQPILISGYYKGAHHGDGDRFRWVNLEPGVVLKATVSEERLVVNNEDQTVRGLHLNSMSYQGNEVALPENMGSDIPVYGHFLPDDLNGFLEQHREKELTVSLKDDGIAAFVGDWEITIPLKTIPTSWRLITKKPDFIFYDGWMVGARSVLDESVFSSGLPALETPEAQQFAKDVNQKLKEYEPLWQLFEFMTVLYVPNYEMSLQWRDQAEESLRVKGEGMSHEEIREFVYYFWRSVHPGIHIKNLAQDNDHTDQVVIINNDHTFKELLTPDQVRIRF